MYLHRYRVGTRLASGFLAVISLLVLIAAIGIWRLGSVADASRQSLATPLVKERLLDELLRNISVGVRRTLAIVKCPDNTLETVFAADAKQSTARGNDILKDVNALLVGETEQGLMKRVAEHRVAYLKVRDDAVKLKKEGKVAEANQLFDAEFGPISTAYIASVQALVDLQRKSIADESTRIDAGAGNGRLAIGGVGAAAVLIAVALAWLLTRSITQPLAQASRMADAVTRGDLSQRLAPTGSDEISALMRAFDTMTASLHDMVSQVRDSALSIQTASSEVAVGNQDLANRTEQTSANLQRAASSMDQLTATVRESDDSARKANQLASSASEVATRGGVVVSQVVSTMEEIDASSKKIADIISVIDGIAFQTNILALNAAVEAARAGEQGRGFAVVASEVRSLAQRSADAAREIKALIGSSVEKVGDGARLVRQAGTTMSEIVASVRSVSAIIGAISASSGEQSTGLGQINGAVTDLDRMTQQNAALVEQSAAAAESLKDQAVRLAGVVSAFRLQ